VKNLRKCLKCGQVSVIPSHRDECFNCWANVRDGFHNRPFVGLKTMLRKEAKDESSSWVKN
jgi:hypothetical protein